MSSYENLEFQRLYELLNEYFSDFNRAALMTTDGQTIYLKYGTFVDIGTLPLSAEVSHRYLQLQDQDMVILNDPYSGGSLLSSPTLVLGMGLKPGKADFLLVSRLSLKMPSGPHKTIDEEGLRIPPSPLMNQGQMNEALLEALASHPQAPAELVSAVRAEAQKLLAFRELFIGCINGNKIDLSKTVVRNYLKATENIIAAFIDEWPEGDQQFEEALSENESIRLNLQIHKGNIKFDFNGTSKGQRVFLTDASTYGVCVGAFLSYLRQPIPINSGIFSRMHIVAPRGSLVNATFPQPIRLGHTDGQLVIKNLIYDTAGRLYKKFLVGRGASTQLKYELNFGGGKFFSDALSYGHGANSSRKGIVTSYNLLQVELGLSVEKAESAFPIQFLQSSIRSDSGGDGQYRGGHGMTRTVKVLAPCELKWQYISPVRKPEGIEGGKSALPAEIILIRGRGDTQTKTELTSEGVVPLQVGDVISFMTPGGGGYGAPMQATTKS